MRHSLSYWHKHMPQYYNVSGCRQTILITETAYWGRMGFYKTSNVALRCGWAKDHFSSTHLLKRDRFLSWPVWEDRQRPFLCNSGQDRNMSHYRRDLCWYWLSDWMIGWRGLFEPPRWRCAMSSSCSPPSNWSSPFFSVLWLWIKQVISSTSELPFLLLPFSPVFDRLGRKVIVFCFPARLIFFFFFSEPFLFAVVALVHSEVILCFLNHSTDYFAP